MQFVTLQRNHEIAVETTDGLGVSKRALNRIRIQAEKEGRKGGIFRVGVMGGGCSGLSYHFAFEDKPRESDLVIMEDDIRICVDPKSLRVLKGCVLDYQESLMRRGFVVRHPTKVKSCSCGDSFSPG